MSRRSKRKPKVAWTTTRTKWTGDVLVETEAGMVARRDAHSAVQGDRGVLVLVHPDMTAAEATVELRRLADELERSGHA